ncbi:MAG: tetratricopeptide repeat protein [Gammaproteobacteria bacterium]|nr:tetratricopeptide repeat protein [Gammaproteobacteria bacterium]
MKLLNNIDFHFFLSGRVIILLVGMFMLSACASVQREKVTPPPLQYPGPVVQVDDVDVLAVSPEMEKFLERYVLKYSNQQTRLDMLTTAVARTGVLGFEYNESHTMTSSEAFDARMGNCVAFSNLMIALARRAGLNARYQEVSIRSDWANYEGDTVLLYKHVNVVVETRHMSWVVDVSGLDIRPTDHRTLIDDSYAKALYLNNNAVEALLDNDLPRAYAYMRSAIEADSRVTDPWVNLGVLYGRNDQLDEAVFAFNRALQIDSNEYSALSNLYEVYLEQEDFESAANLEPRVERYRRNNPYYLLRLSDEALRQEQYEESISLLRKAIKKKEDDHELHFALAKTQYLSGELAEAESSLLRARELAPESMMVYYDRPLEELVSEK